MDSTEKLPGKDTDQKVPVYRSVFNDAYRSNVCSSELSYYDKYRSTRNDTTMDRRMSTSSPEYAIPDTEPSETVKSTNKPTSYVGFANLPNQVYWKAAQKGFEFTLMVVGGSGLGKSTLINSLFLTDIYDPVIYPGPTARSKPTMSVETASVCLKEGGVRLTLTLVDTPGFGDAINNSECWIPVVEFVEKKYEDFFVSENKVNRKPFQDERVHCCLYFIQPTGHGLRPLDVEFMKHLCDKVNIVPVIAKADTLTPEECLAFKQQICKDIEQNNIKIYKFPDVHKDDEDYELNKSLNERVPFAVVGSNVVIEVDGKNVRGRKYSWGVINIENMEHCDFIALRKMLISTHMQDLKDTTHNIHYENYRCRKLCVMGGNGGLAKNPLLEFDSAKQDRDMKLQKVIEDMESQFEQIVKEKEKAFKDSEKLLKMRLGVLKKSLDEETEELETMRKKFEMEKCDWEKETGGYGTADHKKEKKIFNIMKK